MTAPPIGAPWTCLCRLYAPSQFFIQRNAERYKKSPQVTMIQLTFLQKNRYDNRNILEISHL